MDLTLDGITQPLQEWAADYGIPCRLIRQRLKRGWSAERAITEPMLARNNARLTRSDMRDCPAPVRKTASRYTYNGMSLTVPEWSERSGLSMRRLYARLGREWPIEHALHGRPAGYKKRPRHQPRLIAFDGRVLTLAEWAKRIGISKSTLRVRLKNDWPLERALTEPANRIARGRAPRIVELNGLSLTVKEWARRIGVATCTLNQRLNSPDWTIERALTTKNAGTYRHDGRRRPHDPMTMEISHY